MRVGAIVLAAGRSSRYRAAGGAAPTKLVDLFAGEPLVRHPARAAIEAGLRPVVVVTGHAAAAVRAALGDLPLVLVHNADYGTGLASSLRVGLAAMGPDAAAAVILLGDMPLVDSSMIAALVGALARAPAAEAVAPVVDGVRGNPVVLRRTLFAAASDLSGDEGARRLLRDRGSAVLEVPVAGDAVRHDVDEPGGLTP